MSWRSIFALLILAVVASAWGGLRLGNWLVAHGPALAGNMQERLETPTVPVLDADGKPLTSQPPQPLIDGRLGVPSKPTEVAWEIPAESLNQTKSNQVVAVATTPITMVEAQQIAAANSGGSRNLVGIADVGNLMGGNAKPPLQPIDVPAPPPPPNATQASPRGNAQAWQANLRQDLQACSAESFFDRPSCAWAARNKYCTPNSAWGATPDCPAKSF